MSFIYSVILQSNQPLSWGLCHPFTSKLITLLDGMAAPSLEGGRTCVDGNSSIFCLGRCHISPILSGRIVVIPVWHGTEGCLCKELQSRAELHGEGAFPMKQGPPASASLQSFGTHSLQSKQLLGSSQPPRSPEAPKPKGWMMGILESGLHSYIQEALL